MLAITECRVASKRSTKFQTPRVQHYNVKLSVFDLSAFDIASRSKFSITALVPAM